MSYQKKDYLKKISLLFFIVALSGAAMTAKAMEPKKELPKTKSIKGAELETILFDAINTLSVKEVKKIMEQKSLNFDNFIQKEKTPLMTAIDKYFSSTKDSDKESAIDIISIILKKITNKNKDENDKLEDILIDAIDNGYIKIVEKIISQNIVNTYNLRFKYLKTPLWYAILSYNRKTNQDIKSKIFDIIKILIEKAGHYDTKYHRIEDKSSEAYKYLYEKAETLLLKKLKNLNPRDKEIEKIFFNSIRNGYTKIIKEILSKNLVDAQNISSYPQYDTPLKVAIYFYNTENEDLKNKIFEVIKLLVKEGRCKNVQDAMIKEKDSEAYKYLKEKRILE